MAASNELTLANSKNDLTTQALLNHQLKPMG